MTLSPKAKAIGLLGGSNVFQYAPNPIGWIDPWGLSADSAILERISAMKNAMSIDEIKRTTYAVARVTTKDGISEYWVAAAGKVGNVPRIIREAAGTDIVAKNKNKRGNGQNRLNDAERTIIRTAKKQGAKIEAMGATRDMCPMCEKASKRAGILSKISTPIKSRRGCV